MILKNGEPFDGLYCPKCDQCGKLGIETPFSTPLFWKLGNAVYWRAFNVSGKTIYKLLCSDCEQALDSKAITEEDLK